MQKGYKVWYILLAYIFLLLALIIVWWVYTWRIAIETRQQPNPDFDAITGDIYFAESIYDLEQYKDLITPTNNLDIYIYSFTFDSLREFFAEIASEEWTNTRFLIESDKYNHDDSDYYETKQAYQDIDNIDFKNADHLDINLQHAKTLLMDKSFIIQTANFTYSGFFRSREIFFYSENTNILESLEYIYQQDWQGKPIDENKIHDNLLVCDVNCRQWFEDILSSADEEIIVYSQNFTDNRLINIVDSMDDIDIRMLLSDFDSNYFVENRLDDAKVKFQDDPHIHAKSFLVDQEYLVIGSSNFTQNSIENNREISIVIKDKEVINNYLEMFNRDWNY